VLAVVDAIGAAGSRANRGKRGAPRSGSANRPDQISALRRREPDARRLLPGYKTAGWPSVLSLEFPPDHLSLREVVSAALGVLIPRSGQSIEEVTVIQQGQVFKLKAKGADGEPLWAYRYRLDGRGSARPQVGGFASRAQAQKALAKELARLGPGGRGATITLGELVDEYLGLHQAERVTIAKLRWLLGKATAVLSG
jgi:hypothetical protein